MSADEYTPTLDVARRAFIQGAAYAMTDVEFEAALSPWDETEELDDPQTDRLLGAAFDRLVAAVRAEVEAERDARLAAARSADHWPESVCMDCGGANPVWWTSGIAWNQAMGNEGGILCPSCFAVRFERSFDEPMRAVLEVQVTYSAASPATEEGAESA